MIAPEMVALGIAIGGWMGWVLAEWQFQRSLGPGRVSAKQQKEYDRQRALLPPSPCQTLTSKTLNTQPTNGVVYTGPCPKCGGEEQP